MPELRKDYHLGRWVIIAPTRGKRPIEFEPQNRRPNKTCFFCPGNERTTPKEIGRLGSKGKWRIRWFPNKYNAVGMEGLPVLKNSGIYTQGTAYGKHEIIVETPSDKKQLWDFSVKEIAGLFQIYNNRIEVLGKKKGISYVTVFKNYGRDGGASLQHSHSQVVSMNIMPPNVREELTAYGKGVCRYCKVIKSEAKSKRKCFETRETIAFAPFASRFGYEMWIFPKRHVKKLSVLTESELTDFASVLLKALKRLKKLNAAYNYVLHYSPSGFNNHFHIELTPRISKWAGLEIGAGIIVNTVSPEDAAKFYRGKAKR